MISTSNEFFSDMDVRVPNIRSAAIIRRNNTILLMYRKKQNREFYVLIGGHMQNGETPEETIIREVHEETSLMIDNLKPAFEFKDFIKNIHEYYYLCDVKDGIPNLGHDEKLKNNPNNIYELQWKGLDEIEKVNLLPKAAKEWIQETLVDSNHSFTT